MDARLLVAGALLLGAVLRILYGVYKAFVDKRFIRLDWLRIVIELFAALVFGSSAVLVLVSFGFIKPGANTVAALVAGLFGPDLLNLLAKHLKTQYVAPKVTKELPSTLTPRQQKAIDYVAATGSITNDQYQKLVGVSNATATRDLQVLVQKGLLKQVGAKKGVRYTQ